MRRIVPLTLIMMLLIIGCARAPQAQSTLPTPEPTVESSESCLDPQNAGAGMSFHRGRRPFPSGGTKLIL